MLGQVRLINNYMVYQPQNLDQHINIFPSIRYNRAPDGNVYAALPHTLDHALILNNLGYKAPSPIVSNYDWPGRYTPYEHQRHTAEFFTLNPRCFCLNGMGTGKTMAALWGSDFLMKIGRRKRALILSPLSTLERVWGNELFVNFPNRTFAVLHGDRKKRLRLLQQEVDFYIINHDGIETIYEELVKRTDINLYIIDELASFRNQKTKTWRMLKSLILPDTYAWGLGGTPTPNEPTDAYAQMKLIKPDNYNGSYTRFKNEVMQQFGAYRWVPRHRSEEQVYRIMQPCLRYALKDCVDLPPTIYHDRDAELSPEQRHHYNELRREAITEIAGVEVTAVNAAVLVSKLVQAACGVIYGSGEKIELDFGPRLTILKEAIEEAQSKVIIFVPFTGVLDALHRELSKHWTCAVVDGGVSANKRNQIFKAYMDQPDPHIIIANPGTMSHGLTLTAADTIIWYAPVYSNEQYEQANARIARPGQKLITNIVHIAATATERRIYGVLRERGRLQSVVLGLAQEGR